LPAKGDRPRLINLLYFGTGLGCTNQRQEVHAVGQWACAVRSVNWTFAGANSDKFESYKVR